MRLVINQADPVSNIAVSMFKIVDAVQIAANAGWPNAPNRKGTGVANIGEEFTSVLKLVSSDMLASESTEKDGNAFLGD